MNIVVRNKLIFVFTALSLIPKPNILSPSHNSCGQILFSFKTVDIIQHRAEPSCTRLTVPCGLKINPYAGHTLTVTNMSVQRLLSSKLGTEYTGERPNKSCENTVRYCHI